MSTTKKLSKLQKAVAAVNDLFSGLPSKEERAETQEILEKLISLLSDLQARIKALPDDEEVRKVSESAQKLSDFLVRASHHPTLSVALGLATRKEMSKTRRSRSSPDQTRQLIAELESLSTENIPQRLLGGNGCSALELKQIAQGLNIRIDQRMNREQIVDRIAKWFAMRRGFSVLGPKEIADSH